jgi:type IV pilus assembly protein PilM
MLEILTLKSEVLGLDISDLSLKIANVKRKGDKFYLASFGEEIIPKGVIGEGEIKNEDLLAKIIKEGLKKVKGEKIKTKYVACSLPEEKSYIRVIQMPKMEEEELAGAVRFEAENHIPVPIDDVYLDFQVIHPLYNHLDHLDILIATIPKKIVDPYILSLRQAGLLPRVLEIESSAIARTLIKDDVSHFPVLLIDLGATRTSFIIFSGTSLKFTSSIPISSQKFTEAISKTLKINLVKAEELKLKHGLKKNDREGELVFEALTPILRDLIEQIKNHLIYYQSHAEHEHLPSNIKEVKEILLCGGGANLKGLPEFLLNELKIKTGLGDPWVNILRRKPEMPFEKSLSFTTALGLALRGAKYD